MTAKLQVAEAIGQYLSDAKGQVVPDEYKQTEVGVIPEDWDVYDFGSLINYRKGFAFKSVDYRDAGVRVIRISDTSYAKIENEAPIYISEEKAKSYSVWELKTDDLIFSTVGSKPPMYDSLVGKAIIVTDCHSGSLLNQNAVRIRAKSSVVGIQYLLLNHFRTERYIDFIETIYRGNANQASVTLKNLFDFKIPLPRSENEQTAIANALSDVDALINELEKLIAKKQAIKTATMQQLLTGRTRLPQFALREDGTAKGYKQCELGEIPEDWDQKRIGDFTDCTAGGTPSTSIPSYWGGDNPWMSSGELHLKRVYVVAERITDHGLLNSSTKYVPENSVLIGLAGQGKTRGTVAISKISLCTNQSIAAIFPSKSHSTDYLYYNLDQRYEELRGLSTGDGGRGGLNLTIIRNLLIPFPQVDEQIAIATVISDIDAEIEAHKQHLVKIRQIKQGMMQELLTGKTRLIKPDIKDGSYG